MFVFLPWLSDLFGTVRNYLQDVVLCMVVQLYTVVTAYAAPDSRPSRVETILNHVVYPWNDENLLFYLCFPSNFCNCTGSN